MLGRLGSSLSSLDGPHRYHPSAMRLLRHAGLRE